MELIADGLLIATALIAGLYCLVLSRRLRRLTESGAGIGAQIEALDRALAETRGALRETRDGMSELRASARAAASELREATERGQATAERVEQGARQAEATLQRLYEARERVEALERRGDPAEGAEPAEIARTNTARPDAGDGRETVVVEAVAVQEPTREPDDGAPRARGTHGGKGRTNGAAAPGAAQGTAGASGEEGEKR